MRGSKGRRHEGGEGRPDEDGALPAQAQPRRVQPVVNVVVTIAAVVIAVAIAAAIAGEGPRGPLTHRRWVTGHGGPCGRAGRQAESDVGVRVVVGVGSMLGLWNDVAYAQYPISQCRSDVRSRWGASFPCVFWKAGSTLCTRAHTLYSTK